MRVIGKQWWFNAQYMFERPDLGIDSPTEIHIPAGRAVEIELETRDVIHSFWIPKLHGKVDLVPGRANVLELQADRPGIYEGECAEFCGVQHAHMRLQVIAQPPAEYAAWIEAQRQPAATPHDPLGARGSEVFQATSCPVCHTVRGTEAQGRVGLDLTHVASRKRLAGGMLENSPANLAAWVIDAQALKPGSQMPTLGRTLEPRDFSALMAYLQSLR